MPINFSSYQQIVFNQNSQCGKCDTFYYDKNKSLKFQFNSTFETNAEDTFTDISLLEHFGNILPVGGTLTIPNPPNFTPTSLCVPPYTPKSSLALYTQTKLRIYVVVNFVFTGDWRIIRDTGDMEIYEVRYSANLDTMRNSFILALIGNATNSFQLETSSTITNTGTSITISNANQEFGYIGNNINTLTPPENPTPNYFGFRTYWSATDKRLVAWNVDKWLGSCGSASGTGDSFFYRNFFNSIVGKENKIGRVSMTLTNTQNFDITYRYRLKSAGGVWSVIKNVVIPANSVLNYEDNFIMPSYSLAGVQLESFDSFPTLGGNDFQALDEWFYIDNIKIETRDNIIKIEKKDCNGVITQIPYTLSYINENTLVEILPIYIEDAIQLIITDTSNNIYNSNIFKLIDVNDLQCKNLIKFEWTSNCEFSVIDYANLPFTNEMYIQAYISDVDLRVLDSVFFKNQLGKEVNVYELSTEQYELKIGLYTSILHNVLQRAFMHDYIAIDNQEYYRSDGSKYTKANINNGYYTARITLSKVGTEVEKSLCC